MAGGGTGGHVLPALAVARELRARGHQVRFVGVERGLEAKLVPAANFPIEWIEIGGLNRVGFRQTVGTLAELPFRVGQGAPARAYDAPRAVFSVGRFAPGAGLRVVLGGRLPIVGLER